MEAALIAIVRVLLSLFVKADAATRVEIGKELLATVKRLVGDTSVVAPCGMGNDYMTPEEHGMVKANAGKINTIKAIRARTGLGLKDAKDLFERFYPQIPLVPMNQLSHSDIVYRLNKLVRYSPTSDGWMDTEPTGRYVNIVQLAQTLGVNISGDENRCY